MQLVLVSMLGLMVGSAIGAKVKIGDLIPICKLSDPNINECSRNSANQLVPYMVKGIREYNFPPLDPLTLPFMELTQSENSQGLKLNVTDATHTGMKNLKFTAFRMDFQKGYFEADMVVPRYELTGTCHSGGRILLLPIVGEGFCNLTAENLQFDLKIVAKPEVRNGKSYFKTESFNTEMRFTKAYMKFDGLFGNNKQLGDAMNQFLNDNAFEVMNEMRPTLQKAWAELLQALMERLTAHTPADELFH